jgi:hypothetical protein
MHYKGFGYPSVKAPGISNQFSNYSFYGFIPCPILVSVPTIGHLRAVTVNYLATCACFNKPLNNLQLSGHSVYLAIAIKRIALNNIEI